MKTNGLYGKKYMQIETLERTLQAPGDNDVVVKVAACGVCGTDVNFVTQWADEPMPLGHEIAAEVVEVGKAVTHVQPGDHVIVEDMSMCGICLNCKRGRPDICIACHDLDSQSGMGQYMRVRYNNLVKYEGMSAIEACLTEPLSVSLSSVLNAEIPLNGSVVVIGRGPLGLMSAKVAKLQGAGFVAATHINTQSRLGKARVDLAAKMGVDLVIDADKEDVEAVVKKECPEGVDRVIVSAPPSGLHDALKIVGYGGIITFYGLHFGDGRVINIDINDLIFRKITLRPVFAEPAVNFSISIELLRKGLIPARDLVTHQVAPKDVRTIINSIADKDEPVVKAVVLPNG